MFDYVINYTIAPDATTTTTTRLTSTTKNMSSDGDDDYMEDTEDIDPTIFHIWDPLHKPVTLQYTTEQLHSERVVVARIN